MDGIACGCLAALFVDWFVRTRGEERSRRGWWLKPSSIAGAAILFFVALWPQWTITRTIGRSGLDGTLLSLGACLIAIPAALKRTSGRSWSEPLRWLGRNSYEVYMTHEFIVVWAVAAFARFHAGPQSVWIIAITVVSGLSGAAVARHYSEPVNRYLRPARSRSRTVVIDQKLQKAS
jgi:peptidoglycan/LPS O-acetylase OafA/YrhL